MDCVQLVSMCVHKWVWCLFSAATECQFLFFTEMPCWFFYCKSSCWIYLCNELYFMIYPWKRPFFNKFSAYLQGGGERGVEEVCRKYWRLMNALIRFYFHSFVINRKKPYEIKYFCYRDYKRDKLCATKYNKYKIHFFFCQEGTK